MNVVTRQNIFSFPVYRSEDCGEKTNTSYPIRVEIEGTDEQIINTVSNVARYDHTAGYFRNYHRSSDDFIHAKLIITDCDNDTDDPAGWIEPDDVKLRLPGVAFIAVSSRNHNRAKQKVKPDGSVITKTARPRWHYWFPLRRTYTADDKQLLKDTACRIKTCNPQMDEAALDAPSRFLYGYRDNDVSVQVCHGDVDVIEYFEQHPCEPYKSTGRDGARGEDGVGLSLEDVASGQWNGDPIPLGKIHNTLRSILLAALTRYGDADDCAKAKQVYKTAAEHCEVQQPIGQLERCFRDGVEYYRTHIKTQPGYIPPEEYAKQMEENETVQINYDALTEDDLLNNKDLYKAVIGMQPAERVSAEAMLKKAAKRLKIGGGAGIVTKMLRAVEIENKQITGKQDDDVQYKEECFTGADAAFCYRFKYPTWYGCDDHGIIGCKPGVAASLPMTICQHPILITKRWIDIDTGDVSYNVSWRRDGEGWKTAEYLPGSVIQDARQLLPAFADRGINVTSNTAGMMAAFMGDMIEANRGIPTEYTTGRMGWRNDGTFIPYSDGITLDPRKVDAKGFCESIKSAGDFDTWKKLVNLYRDGKHIAVQILLAASFASVMVPFTCGLPFIVHIWESTSGAGKTVALMMAASVWGDPSGGRYLQSMYSTTVGLQKLAVTANNMPVVLDELQTIARSANVDLGRIIYMLCEGQEKTRGTKTGGLRQKGSWANISITSGEQPLTTEEDREGAVARTVNVGAEGKIFGTDAAAMQVAQVVSANYGHAGAQFVKWMQQDGRIDELKGLYTFSDDRKKLAGVDVVGKQINDAVLLLLASRILAEVIFDDDHALTVEDLLPYLVTNKAIDINTRAWSWFKGHVSSNVDHFNEIAPGFMRHGYKGEFWGQIEDYCDGVSKIVINAEIARREFKAAGYDYTAFAKWARDKGLSVVNPNDTTHPYTKQVSIGGHKVRCLVLDLKKAEDEQMKMEQIVRDGLPAWGDPKRGLLIQLQTLKMTYTDPQSIHPDKWDPVTRQLSQTLARAVQTAFGANDPYAKWCNDVSRQISGSTSIPD